MGTKFSAIATYNSQKIPLPNTIKDIDPRNVYNLPNNNLMYSSIVSKLIDKGITDFNPFRIVSLQSLLENGYCVPYPTYIGNDVYIFRLIFSDDLEYLPIGDVVVNIKNILGIPTPNSTDNKHFPLNENGYNLENSTSSGSISDVFQIPCEGAFLKIFTSSFNRGGVYGETSISGVYQNDWVMWGPNNCINYSADINGSPNALTITNTTDTPWWQLDLQYDTTIQNIVVFNRQTFPEYSAISNSIVTVTNQNGNIVYTGYFGNRTAPKYVFTLPSGISGSKIRITRNLTNTNLILNKVLINVNYKKLGWYLDNNNTPALIQGNLASYWGDDNNQNRLEGTNSGGWLSSLDNISGKYTIAGVQSNKQFVGGNVCPNYQGSSLPVNDYAKYQPVGKNSNWMFDDIPVLLVKNDPLYSSVIPAIKWQPSAISWGWGNYGNWACSEVRGNVYSNTINFGTVFSVGDNDAAWYKNIQSVNTGDAFGIMMTTRAYAGIHSDFVINLSEMYPDNPKYDNNSTDMIDFRSPSGEIRYNSTHIFIYTSPFGTFSAMNNDNNSQLSGVRGQNWKYFDIRPEILNLFCCTRGSTNATNILQVRDLNTDLDLSTYCGNYTANSAICTSPIDKYCTADKVGNTYKDILQRDYSPCKQLFMNNQGLYDNKAQAYANINPSDKFSSCLKPVKPFDPQVPQYIRDAYAANPQCVDNDCVLYGYKNTFMNNSECNLSFTTCIQNVDVEVGNSVNSKLTINPNINCPSGTVTGNTNVDCIVNWGNCVNNVQSGTVSTFASGTGKACPVGTSVSNPNTTRPCGIDCVLNWSPWVCNDFTGIKTRTATVVTPASADKPACPTGSGLTQTAPCDSVDCGYTTSWGNCSQPCGGGTQTQNIVVTQQPKYGGAACPTPQTLSCNTQTCNSTTPVNCETEWGNWSNCINGTQTRVARIKTQPANGGTACPSNLTETKSCSTDCVVSDWGGWSACDCSTKKRTISRKIITPANGGTACPVLTQTTDCSDQCVSNDKILGMDKTTFIIVMVVLGVVVVGIIIASVLK